MAVWPFPSTACDLWWEEEEEEVGVKWGKRKILVVWRWW